MATSKLFSVIGVSTDNGKTKVRYANDLPSRVKTLIRVGHTNVELFELPEAMTKEAGLAYAREHNLFTIPSKDAEVSAEQVAAIAGE